MAVYRRYSQREKGWRWYVDYYPEGKQGSRIRLKLPPHIQGEEDARAWERQIRNAGEGHLQEEPAGTSLSDLWPLYHRYVAIHRLPSTAGDVAVAGRHFVHILADIDVSRINSAYLDLYKEARQAEGASNRTISKELSWFSGFRKWARKHGHVDMPAFDIEPLPFTRPLPVVLSVDEVARLLDASDPLHRAYFSLCYFCGLRRAEVNAIKWEDINVQDGGHVLTITGKGDRQRLEPVPPVAMDALRAIMPQPTHGYIFINRQTGEPLKRTNKALKSAARKAGITKNVYPHILRHSHGAHHIDAGTDIRVLQELLGHKDIETTQWYSQVAMGAKQKASHAFALAFDKRDKKGHQTKNGPQRKPRKPA